VLRNRRLAGTLSLTTRASREPQVREADVALPDGKLSLSRNQVATGGQAATVQSRAEDR